MKLKNIKTELLSTKIDELFKKRIKLAYLISLEAYRLVKKAHEEYKKDFKWSIFYPFEFKAQNFNDFEHDLFGGGGFYNTKNKTVLNIIQEVEPETQKVIYIDAFWYKVRHQLISDKEDKFIHRADIVGQILSDNKDDIDFYIQYCTMKELGDIVFEDEDLKRIVRWKIEIESIQTIYDEYINSKNDSNNVSQNTKDENLVIEELLKE